MHLQRVLRATNRVILALLPTCLASVSAFAGNFAFVTNQNSSDLSVLDLDRRVEKSRIAIPGNPAGIVVSSELGAFFTVSPDSSTVRKFSLKSCGEESRIVLDGGPTGIAVDPSTRRIFVSDWYNARVFVIDAEEMTLMDELGTGSAPAGLVVARDGSWLASAERDADQVSLFNLSDLSLRRVVKVGERPYGLAEGPNGLLFVANVGSNSVTVIDPLKGTVRASIAVGERPYGVSFAAGNAYVTDQYADTISVVSLNGFVFRGTIDVGEYPEGIDVTADGGIVVSTNWFSNTVSLIDPTTNKVIGEIETGDGPRAFGRFTYMTREGEEPCQAR